MACQRDGIISLKNYIESLGISINIGKNKARGNRGFFRVSKNKQFRIDIATGLSEEEIVQVLVHETIHYIHYYYDKTLKSLDFIFDKYNGDYEEALLSLTVDSIPKSSVEPLFEKKNELKSEISRYTDSIKKLYPDIKLSNRKNELEKQLLRTDAKYLLKYDSVKVFSGFSFKLYSIKNVNNDFKSLTSAQYDYLKLMSAKRKLSKINSRISRLNRYYSTPTELLARSFEYFVLKPEDMKQKTPELYEYYKKVINENKLPILTSFAEKVRSCSSF